MRLQKDLKRLKKLAQEIAHHDRLYYVEANPLLTDFEYDCLKAELQALREKFPDESDTVGSDLPSVLTETQPHRIPMLSLANTYTRRELEAFRERVAVAAKNLIPTFQIEPKIDGMSLNLIYEEGKLIRILTRGDGRNGEDVTRNRRAFHNILSFLSPPYPKVLEVRGEIYIPNAEFERINEEQEKRGLEPYANARNLASGSVKLLDTSEAQRRSLHFLAYGVGYVSEEFEIKTQAEVSEWIHRWGFQGFTFRLLATNGEEIWTAIEDFKRQRTQFPYVTDGTVVKVNDRPLQEQLGCTAKAPRWAIAYKFEPESTETLLKDVRFQVGRTGIITPVAELVPVWLSHSLVSRATLHNTEDMRRKDVRLGDTVVVQKAGDVIPYLSRVVPEKRPPEARIPSIPTRCPSCRTPLVQLAEEVALRCTSVSCPAQIRLKLIHFASPEAMNMDGWGPVLVDQLVSHGLLDDIGDVFDLKGRRTEWLRREPSRTKSIDKVLNSIDKAKSNDLYRLIYGLGIPHVGLEIAKNLARCFVSLDKLTAATREELRDVPLVGNTVAHALEDFFSQERHRHILEKFRHNGVNFRCLSSSGRWTGQIFVFSGSLISMTRSQAKSLVEQNGGQVADTVTFRTHVLVAGENPGQKLSRAREFGIIVWNEESFKKHMSS
ncbi:MAG: NAD-dependent DNA ligase LigA [Puniceicoccales bacterium]|jgi:DNA ligase (NAD+)|nr:NAD-dependent DNA ligase LigA [Puniceicoccales bacterium]